MKSKTNSVPDLYLEKFLLDELDSQQRVKIEEMLRTDPDLKIKVDQIKQDNELFSQRYPFNLKAKVSASFIKNNKKPHSPPLRYAFVGIVIFFCAFTLLPDLNQSTEIPYQESVEILRLKGIQPSLKIYRKTDNGFESLKNNATVANHEVLQLAYIPGSAKYGLIFSLDGNAQITLHYPYTKSDSTQLNNNGETRLSFSYELDNAPRFERFFFLTSDKPLDVQHIMQTANAMLQNNSTFETIIAENNISQTIINLSKDKK